MNIVVLNGFEEYDEEVAIAGSLSLENGDFAIRHSVDLCSVVLGGNNGNNNDCPDDGIYDISTSFPLPGSGGWWGTGFGASGDFEILVQDGTLVGSCSVTFATPVHSIGISSKVTFVALATILGMALFVTVFLVSGQQVFAAQRLRRMRHRDDDSTYTKGMDDVQSANTDFTDYENTNDDETADNTYDDTYDDTYDGTYDDTVTRDMSSVWTGTTVHSTVQATVNHSWGKFWRLGGLLVDRVVNGKPLRTPPAQQQQSSSAGAQDTSMTNDSTASTYSQMKDAETGSSDKADNTSYMVADEYRQMEEDSIDLSASGSSIELNCDSMDVQAHDRRTVGRYACGANDATEGAPALDGIRTTAGKVQGKGFFDTAIAEANWLMDANSERPKERAHPPQTSNFEEGIQVDYHNMSVYTVGLGDKGRYSGNELEDSPSTDDDSRDDGGPDTSSITPAAPRRQTVSFNISTSKHPHHQQDKRTMIPKNPPRKGLQKPEASTLSKVVHGSQIRGNQNPSAKQGRGKVFSKGSFVPWNAPTQSRRQDKWTAASLNPHAEL